MCILRVIGKSNTGKTSSTNDLIRILDEFGIFISVFKHWRPQQISFSTLPAFPEKISAGVYIYTYKGLKIAVINFGDKLQDIIEAFEFLINYRVKANFIICNTRDTGATPEIVKTYSRKLKCKILDFAYDSANSNINDKQIATINYKRAVQIFNHINKS